MAAPNGFTEKVHDLDAKVGGTYRMSFTNFSFTQRMISGDTAPMILPSMILPIRLHF